MTYQRHTWRPKPRERPVDISYPTLWCNPWQVLRMPATRGHGAHWTVTLGPAGAAWRRTDNAEAYRTALDMWRAWMAGNYCADDPRLDQLRRQVLAQLPTIAGRSLECRDCPPGVPCHALELAEMANKTGGLTA